MRKTAVILCLGLMVGAGLGWAQQDMFMTLDTNGDGKIAKDEGPTIFNWSEGLFELKDLNGDGGITREEFTTWFTDARTLKLAEELSDQTFTALDFDQDGKIHKTDEWVGSPEGFDMKDKNKDGLIARDER